MDEPTKPVEAIALPVYASSVRKGGIQYRLIESRQTLKKLDQNKTDPTIFNTTERVGVIVKKAIENQGLSRKKAIWLYTSDDNLRSSDRNIIKSKTTLNNIIYGRYSNKNWDLKTCWHLARQIGIPIQYFTRSVKTLGEPELGVDTFLKENTHRFSIADYQEKSVKDTYIVRVRKYGSKKTRKIMVEETSEQNARSLINQRLDRTEIIGVRSIDWEEGKKVYFI